MSDLLRLGFPTLALLALPALAQDVTEFEKSDENGKPRVRVRESIIGFNDPSMNVESFVSSPDGRRVAYMVMAGDGLAVVVDGEKGELFEGVADGSLRFSPDGKHFGYVATRPGKQIVVQDGKTYEYEGVHKQGLLFGPVGGRSAWVATRDGTWVATVDGQEGPPYTGIPQAVTFSDDGRRTAYLANSGGKFLVVVDGEEGPLFDNIAGLTFTTGGQHVLYMGIRDTKWFAVIDSEAHGPYDELRSMAGAKSAPSPESPMSSPFEISANGARVGFVAQRGEEFFVVVDGKEQGPFEACAGLALSPEGSRVAFLASRGEGWFMNVDGVEETGRTFESLSFSPDGKRLASVVKRNDKHVARIDAEEGKEYDRIDGAGIRFSPVGGRTAYQAELGGERMVVVDGVEGPRFRRPGKVPLSFIPNSDRPMYSIRRGEKEFLFIDGVEGPPVLSLRSLVFSPDGKRYAYAAEKDKNRWVVVVDGVEFGPGGKLEPGSPRAYRSLGKRTPLFSPDGRRVAWVGVTEKGWVAAVDGVESRPYEIVQKSALDFSPDGEHVVFIGQRAGKKMIVVDDFEIDGGWDGFLQHSDPAWDGSRRFSVRGSRSPRYLLIEVDVL